jgi:uncharacterized protein with PIN domain
MKFAADCMLGTLAKWLMILGHDVAYFRVIEDKDLVDLAVREKRTILTSDRRLVQRRNARPHVLVKGHDLKEQIAQVLRECRLTIRPENLFGRCLKCNAANEQVSREAVHGEVPIYVYRTQSRFTRCPHCRQIYWRATHVTRMLAHLGGPDFMTATRQRAARPG